jgi:hypothetical protein
MRRAAAAKGPSRSGARSEAELPAADSGSADAAPIRRAVALSGLAVGPAAAQGSAGQGLAVGQIQPQAADLGALRRQAAQHGPTIRRMSVNGVAKLSTVSGTTSAKHVMAEAGQAADAAAGYGSRTYVTSEATLTAAVDANGHNFAAGPARSDRVNINASVPIYQYDKTNAPPAGLAAGQPVARSINGVATNCEIGAVKTGTGDVSITHFKKV